MLVSSGEDKFKVQSTQNVLSVQRKQNVSQITLFNLVVSMFIKPNSRSFCLDCSKLWYFPYYTASTEEFSWRYVSQEINNIAGFQTI